MCFSPEIDVTAGVVVGAIGLEALRHVHRWRDLPLGSLPLLFGAHQLTEAYVWWGLTGEASASVGNRALAAYTVFAFVVLPLLVPLAVLAVEPDRNRRSLAAGFAGLGGVVAWLYASAMLDGPVSAAVTGHTLSYETGVDDGGIVAALYMLATVGALLSSSHRRIVVFGTANLVALPILTLLAVEALASLWCIWAAVASVVIAAHLREAEGTEIPAGGQRTRPSEVLAAWLERVHFRPH